MSDTEIVAQHTPGPWETVGDPPTEIGAMMGTPDCIIVADTMLLHGIPTTRQLADARLIAAAPDLLAALNATLDAYMDFVNAESDPIARAIVDQALAAIARATEVGQ